MEDYISAQPDDVLADDDAEGDEAEDTAMSRMYLTMPTEDGMNRLLAMWNRFIAKRPAANDVEKEWWKVFGYLSAIRVWNATDRIEMATQAFVARQLLNNPGQPVRLEVDLWFRHNAELRANAQEALEEILEDLGGRLLDFVTIEPIRYQVALVEVPADEADSVRNRSGSLADASEIMAIRPQSLYSTAPDHDDHAADQDAPSQPAPARPAVAAILDGYPMQNHNLLAGRVEVVEVDITAAMVPVNRRYHGTAISSLILHGDLAEGNAPLDRPIKAVPVLAAPQNLNDERTDRDRLPLGIIYRAVTALKRGVDGSAAAGPDVILINHSICNAEGAFVQRASPWARLLDWMSNEYGVLFIVSAGNIRTPFISTYSDAAAFLSAPEVERQIAILRALEASKGVRGLLSPAEAMSALTVGALHLDGAGDCPAPDVDPFAKIGVTNLSSAVGLGINRSLKPDLVEAGGRQTAIHKDEDGQHVVWAGESGHIGLAAASPANFGGSASKTKRSTGTSNAAALVTRAGVRVVDALEEVLEAEGTTLRQYSRAHLATRALLVHGAAWRDAGTLLDATYPPAETKQWRRRRNSIAKFLGYGRSDIERVISGDVNRITLLADDVIQHDQLHEYRVPIPTSMIGTRELRRIVITLAWAPPIHPTSIAYRGAALDIVDQNGKRKFWRGVKTVVQPHPDDIRRGTVAHFVLEGTNNTDFTDAQGLFIGVQARGLHRDFHQTDVPYALAITLEVAQAVEEDIHASVSEAIRLAARPRVRVTN